MGYRLKWLPVLSCVTSRAYGNSHCISQSKGPGRPLLECCDYFIRTWIILCLVICWICIQIWVQSWNCGQPKVTWSFAFDFKGPHFLSNSTVAEWFEGALFQLLCRDRSIWCTALCHGSKIPSLWGFCTPLTYSCSWSYKSLIRATESFSATAGTDFKDAPGKEKTSAEQYNSCWQAFSTFSILKKINGSFLSVMLVC